MEKKFFTLLILLALLNFKTVFAQPVQPGGLIMDDEEYLETEYTIVRRTAIGLQKSLKSLAPDPQDQGKVSACVGYALSYALSIRRKLLCDYNCRCNRKPESFSASFIYNQIKSSKHCQSGTTLVKGLKLVKTKGTCLNTVFENDPYSCYRKPGPEHEEAALPYRINDFKRIFLLEEECRKEDPKAFHANKENNWLNTLNAIHKNNPVVVGLAPFNNSKEKGKGHAMVVVGYDNTPGKETVELIDSYGTGWGNGGFITLSKTEFLDKARYGFILHLGIPACP